MVPLRLSRSRRVQRPWDRKIFGVVAAAAFVLDDDLVGGRPAHRNRPSGGQTEHVRPLGAFANNQVSLHDPACLYCKRLRIPLFLRYTKCCGISIRWASIPADVRSPPGRQFRGRGTHRQGPRRSATTHKELGYVVCLPFAFLASVKPAGGVVCRRLVVTRGAGLRYRPYRRGGVGGISIDTKGIVSQHTVQDRAQLVKTLRGEAKAVPGPLSLPAEMRRSRSAASRPRCGGRRSRTRPSSRTRSSTWPGCSGSSTCSYSPSSRISCWRARGKAGRWMMPGTSSG